jgi:hypothetical protein
MRMYHVATATMNPATGAIQNAVYFLSLSNK